MAGCSLLSRGWSATPCTAPWSAISSSGSSPEDPKALVRQDLIDEGDLDVAAIDDLKRRIARRRKEVGDVR